MARVRDTYLGVIALCFCMAISPFVFSACGGGAEYTSAGAEAPLSDPAVDVPDDIAPDENNPISDEIAKLGDLDKTEQLILGNAYDGAFIIHLEKSAREVSVGGQNFTVKEKYQARDISEIVSVVNSYPQAKLRPFLDTDPVQLDKRRKELERLSGKKMPDWNSVFVIDIAELASAVRLFRELGALSGIATVYPRQKPILLDLAGTPDLTGLQGYLYPEDTNGGLNAMAAWSAGVRGEGAIVVDGEGDWNLSHEDLPLRRDHILGNPYCTTPDTWPLCRSNINHGTGVVGILAGIDNGQGITGMAPRAETYGTVYVNLSRLTDGAGVGIENELPPGSIFAMEVGSCGSLCNFERWPADQFGSVPAEAELQYFDAIRQATAAGITVISAVGNGSIDIGRSDAYLPSQVNISLPENDSDSIIVGGSYGTGHDHRRPSELNCGTRVDVFAWGSGVVTTGYPYTGNPFTWTNVPGGPNPPNDDPNRYFINNFGGTSAATAMVAGAAALVQSYAKRELGVATRYLMPLKMRDILKDSTVSQTPTPDGCNIGHQPEVGEAMTKVDDYLAAMRRDYPAEMTSLDRGDVISDAAMIALRGAGLGLQCVLATPERSDVSCPFEYRCVPHDPVRSDPRCSWEYLCIPHDPVGSDPDCPDEYVWPIGEQLAKDLDFDGDGRADLVQWTNGLWKIDLSTEGGGGDNFGAWDIEITYPPIAGQWVWPYVIDMNRDGRTDFVLYDKEHGKWYIAFTDSALIKDGTWHNWDWTIDYSATWTDTLTLDPFGTDPAVPDARYSRPVPGDYNNDGWIDIAIACSDGNWRIDHGGPNRADFGAFDRTVRYLSDAQLAEAPGWAYLATHGPLGTGTEAFIGYKVPDSLPDEGRLVYFPSTDPSIETMRGVPYRYGGNDSIPLPGKYEGTDWWSGIGVKTLNGNWPISPYSSLIRPHWLDFEDIPPVDIYGGFECRPIVANFDGDNKSDRAVMCPNEWQIAYSSDDLFMDQRAADGVRRIPLGYNEDEFSLPGRSYSGGLSYEYVRETIEFFQEMNSGSPPPIPVDMATVR